MAEMDRNGDGRVELGELMAYMDKKHMRRGGAKNGGGKANTVKANLGRGEQPHCGTCGHVQQKEPQPQ